MHARGCERVSGAKSKQAMPCWKADVALSSAWPPATRPLRRWAGPRMPRPRAAAALRRHARAPSPAVRGPAPSPRACGSRGSRSGRIITERTRCHARGGRRGGPRWCGQCLLRTSTRLNTSRPAAVPSPARGSVCLAGICAAFLDSCGGAAVRLERPGSVSTRGSPSAPPAAATTTTVTPAINTRSSSLASLVGSSATAPPPAAVGPDPPRARRPGSCPATPAFFRACTAASTTPNTPPVGRVLLPLPSPSPSPPPPPPAPSPPLPASSSAASPPRQPRGTCAASLGMPPMSTFPGTSQTQQGAGPAIARRSARVCEAGGAAR